MRRCLVKIFLYGTESDKNQFANALCRLPDFEYRNFQISAFSDYDNFVAELGNGPPECVVVTMNGAGGMEGVIAAKDMHGSVPVIWFSDDKAFGVQSYRLGCTYFHQKPVSSEILSAAMAKCV